MNIIQAINDQRFFLPLFKDMETWHSWEVYLQGLFGLSIKNKKDLDFFNACTGLNSPTYRRVKESYIICGRRSGKSFMSSVIAVYLAAFKDWSKFLSPGEKGSIFIIANDKAQARIIKNYVSGILESNPSFQKLVRKDLTFDIELINGVNISVKTCNFRTIRGFTLLAAILEEIAFWRSEDSANPDKEVLAAIRPALSTINDSLLLGISTPYGKNGVLYDQYRRNFGKPDGPFIWKANTEQMNPTIDKDMINNAIREDPIAASAEWEAEFRKDVESLLPLELVEAAVVPLRLELPPIRGVEYYGFIDPSGGRQDSFTLAIAHKNGSGTIIVDAIREIRPPFRPENVVSEYRNVLKTYGIYSIHSDRYGGEWVTSAFRNVNIIIKSSPLSKSEIYLNFLPLISNGKVELLDNKRLVSQFCSLERKSRSGGKDSIDNFFGHDDLCNVVAGACVMTERREKRTPKIRKIC